MAPTVRIARCRPLTPHGQQRVGEWITELNRPRPDLAEFHLKLIAAAAAGLADPCHGVSSTRSFGSASV